MRNIYYILFATALIAFSSCKTKKGVVVDTVYISSDSVQVANPVKDTIAHTHIDSTETTIEIPAIDTIVYHKLSEYRIGIFMPFMEDSVQKSWDAQREIDYDEFDFPELSIKSLNFYQGISLALDSIDIDSAFTFFVYDTQNDISYLNEQLQKAKNEQLHMLIGGYHAEEVRRIADFAQEEEIYYVSPFSPSSSVGKDNPYYIMMEPPLQTHIEAIGEYVIDTSFQANYIILHQENQKEEEYAQMYSRLFSVYNDSLSEIQTPLTFKEVVVPTEERARKNFNIGSKLSEDLLNWVIIPSFDEAFVHSMLTHLNSKLKVYTIHVAGMPTWSSSEILRFSYFNNLSVHLTSSTSIKNEISISRAYRKRYYRTPDTYALTGHDIIQYYIPYIDQYGLDFFKYMHSIPFDGLKNNYSYTKSADNGCIKNQSVHVYYYKEYEQIAVE